jgi:hypothetical protein
MIGGVVGAFSTAAGSVIPFIAGALTGWSWWVVAVLLDWLAVRFEQHERVR